MNFREQTQVFINANLSHEANRQRLIQIATDDLQKIITSGRGSPRYQTAVDGHPGRVEDAQRQITFTFAFIAEAATFALSFLANRVPKVSGKTAKSFWISVNGRFMEAAAFDPESTPPDAEIVIGNKVPWFRKLDVNMVGNHTLNYRYPGALDDCVRALKRQFGSAVQARRLYSYNFPDRYRPKKTAKFQSPALLITPV